MKLIILSIFLISNLISYSQYTREIYNSSVALGYILHINDTVEVLDRGEIKPYLPGDSITILNDCAILYKDKTINIDVRETNKLLSVNEIEDIKTPMELAGYHQVESGRLRNAAIFAVIGTSLVAIFAFSSDDYRDETQFIIAGAGIIIGVGLNISANTHQIKSGKILQTLK